MTRLQAALAVALLRGVNVVHRQPPDGFFDGTFSVVKEYTCSWCGSKLGERDFWPYDGAGNVRYAVNDSPEPGSTDLRHTNPDEYINCFELAGRLLGG